MSKPNESRPGRAKRLGLRLAAMTGVRPGRRRRHAAATAPRRDRRRRHRRRRSRRGHRAPHPAPNQKAQGTYRLRCWQYGRLLFDEGPVTLSPETRQGARLVAFDRHGGALIVTDAGWTTCQARPFPRRPTSRCRAEAAPCNGA